MTYYMPSAISRGAFILHLYPKETVTTDYLSKVVPAVSGFFAPLPVFPLACSPQGANQPSTRGKQAMGRKSQGRISHEVNEPRSEQARGQKNQGANKPGSEQARGERARARKSQGANRQRGEKAIIRPGVVPECFSETDRHRPSTWHHALSTVELAVVMIY